MSQHARARGDTAVHACDTAERKATILPGEACNTAPSAPRHDSQRVQCARPRCSAQAVGVQLGSGCAPCAPNPVLTQDTVLEHCS